METQFSDRVPKRALVAAGLELMQVGGNPLTRLPAKGPALLYAMPDGSTVRMRTCNDHILVVVAEHPKPGAALNVEGTDYVLLVMPETPRRSGPVTAYLVPTQEIVDAARESHRQWLASNPNTNGHNVTWNLWFDEDGRAGRPHAGFARKWERYKLAGLRNLAAVPPQTSNNLTDVVAEARRHIAAAAGVPVTAVRIAIDMP